MNGYEACGGGGGRSYVREASLTLVAIVNDTYINNILASDSLYMYAAPAGPRPYMKVSILWGSETILNFYHGCQESLAPSLTIKVDLFIEALSVFSMLVSWV